MNKEKNKGGRPKLYKTLEELEYVVEKYFDSVTYTKDNGEVFSKPTMSGLALALGMCRKTLLNYSKDDKFLHTLKKARLKVEVSLESALYANGVAGVIFNLKNNFGWKDQTEQKVTLNDKRTEDMTMEELDAVIAEG